MNRRNVIANAAATAIVNTLPTTGASANSHTLAPGTPAAVVAEGFGAHHPATLAELVTWLNEASPAVRIALAADVRREMAALPIAERLALVIERWKP